MYKTPNYSFINIPSVFVCRKCQLDVFSVVLNCILSICSYGSYGGQQDGQASPQQLAGVLCLF